MSNVGHTYLIRFGRTALSGSYQRYHKVCTNKSPGKSIDQPTNYDSATNFVHILYCQAREFNQSQNNSENEGERDDRHSSSSSFHQQFHRQAYEQKRSNYQKTRDNQGSARNSSSSLTNQNMSHYQRLNVDPGADLSTIKSAYYSLSKLYHPDVVGSDDSEAAENFRLITESYGTLSDPKSRLEYDRVLDLQRISKTNPDDLVWKPTASNNDFKPIFRMQDADMIFRMKQEAAFEQQKKKNPKKFRAGVFKRENGDLDIKAELERLNKHIKVLSKGSNSSFKDGSDFYKMHLYDTIQRKRRDLQDYNYISTGSLGGGFDIGSLLSIFAITTIVICVAVDNFYDIDIAADLDDGLEARLRNIRKREDQTDSS